ncbi:hypothetical protein Bca101_058547 [Brassica carinata]
MEEAKRGLGGGGARHGLGGSCSRSGRSGGGAAETTWPLGFRCCLSFAPNWLVSDSLPRSTLLRTIRRSFTSGSLF